MKHEHEHEHCHHALHVALGISKLVLHAVGTAAAICAVCELHKLHHKIKEHHHKHLL